MVVGPWRKMHGDTKHKRRKTPKKAKFIQPIVFLYTFLYPRIYEAIGKIRQQVSQNNQACEN